MTSPIITTPKRQRRKKNRPPSALSGHEAAAGGSAWEWWRRPTRRVWARAGGPGRPARRAVGVQHGAEPPGGSGGRAPASLGACDPGNDAGQFISGKSLILAALFLSKSARTTIGYLCLLGPLDFKQAMARPDNSAAAFY
jgi:hypothetical protein